MSRLVRLATALTFFAAVAYSPLLTSVGWPDAAFAAAAAALIAAWAASARPRDASRALLAVIAARAVALDSRLVGRLLGVQWTVDYPVELALGALAVIIYIYAALHGDDVRSHR